MTKTESLNKLFLEWENKIPEYKGKLIRDGIINEDKYMLAKNKILFIAKEPNDPLQTSAWNFADIWKDKREFKNSFTFRISEWAYGILNGFPPFDELWLTNPDKLFDCLQSISFMNIKKSGGPGVSERSDIYKHAKDNADFLIRQINIMEPEIIIPSLSFWSEIRNIIFNDNNWIKSGYSIEIKRWNKAKVIDFYHPSSRNAPPALYSLLQNIINSKEFKNLK